MVKTLRGIWINPTKFLNEGTEVMVVYTYGKIIREIEDLFPFECFIQLEGNVINNYVKVEVSV